MAGGSEEALDGGGKELSPDFEGDEPPESDPVKAEPATVKQEEDRVEGSTGGKDPQGDAQASENVQREANEDKSAERDGSKPWIPDRVKRALQRSSTFDEFRKNRPFRYLHMFSGEKDQLGESIKKEAKAARLEVYVESLDRKRDSEVNLASHTTYDEIDKSVTEGEWDGYHSGFPCSSFSRVRWRDSPGGAHPVRSADHIYGLPGNTPSQQKEADEGTLMATRSAWLHKKQVESCKRRQIPEVSTLENPPGAENTGSAWDLPEVKEVLKATCSSSAEFNTCAYQSKQRRRWYKPARWAGKLESMRSLSKVCRCPAWVEHVPVVSKQNTEAAGAYPQELTEEIARKVINTWKRVLNLEWLRWQVNQKADQVSRLQIKWLDNEERKRKRDYDDAEPVATNPISNETTSNVKKRNKAFEANPKETEEMPSSSVGPSKRQRREEQNDFAIGGMRSPAVSVSRLFQVRKTGETISSAWLEFVRDHPKALEAAVRYGSNEAKIDKDTLAAWREKLEALLGAVQADGITLKEAMEFASPLNAPLWDAWRVYSRDPEQFIGQWAREGVPLGMDAEIPESEIFPTVEPEDALETKMDMGILRDLKNYESVESQKEEAILEVDRYIEKGFCKIMTLEEVRERFPEGTASRLALIIKQKPDGTTKRRIVIDMKRSKGNERAQVKERIVLPRAQDIVSSLRLMKAREGELRNPGEQKSVLKSSRAYNEAEIEFVMLDLQDAFCHFGVRREELKHCISPGIENGTAILWVAMLFGFKGAPLIMGRLSAAIGRLVQSLFHPAAGQSQVYIDDIALMIRGTAEQRNLQLSKVLYVLAAFGVQIAMHKGERGKRVTWIGTTFELHSHEVILGTPRKMVLEMQETLAAWTGKGMISTKELRSFVGKLAWVAGIIPRLRWTVTAMYAVLTKALKEEATEETRAQKRALDQRSKVGLVAVKRLGTALPWLKAAFDKPEDLLIRYEALEEKEPTWGIVTDASPRGIGGILIHKVQEEWHIVEAFEAPMQAHQAAALEIQYMEASGQAVMEGLAVLRALQIWSTRLQQMAVVIRSDSTVALAMTKKLASPTKTLNYIAAEISLLLEKTRIERLVPQHIPGTLNKEADWLSRLGDRGEMPAALVNTKLKRTVAFSERCMVMAPPGDPDSPWAKSLPHPNGVYDSL